MLKVGFIVEHIATILLGYSIKTTATNIEIFPHDYDFCFAVINFSG